VTETLDLGSPTHVGRINPPRAHPVARGGLAWVCGDCLRPRSTFRGGGRRARVRAALPA